MPSAGSPASLAPAERDCGWPACRRDGIVTDGRRAASHLSSLGAEAHSGDRSADGRASPCRRQDDARLPSLRGWHPDDRPVHGRDGTGGDRAAPQHRSGATGPAECGPDISGRRRAIRSRRGGQASRRARGVLFRRCGGGRTPYQQAGPHQQAGSRRQAEVTTRPSGALSDGIKPVNGTRTRRHDPTGTRPQAPRLKPDRARQRVRNAEPRRYAARRPRAPPGVRRLSASRRGR